MQNLWSIILAAGESRRMGTPKMLLPFQDRTMIESVIANVAGSKAGNILVVLGAVREPLVQILDNSGVKFCCNENFKEGMLSSVQCGFKNLPGEYRAALVFQGDQPLITPATIDLMIDVYITSGKGIIIPVYKKRRGHPILIDKKYRDEIFLLNAREGLRSLAYRFERDVLEVDTGESGILRDFDTYEEYLQGINQIH
jgi:molybdenum cofactor cytidylyltransferase